ncbi:hypothetical protein BDV96DRAFT_571744 [Lophiotrema nucula]|uniref:Uncharacterized protein n=1 Tax=Lophiotrema nucula TaxID=690887 RepID=A0A6A5ZFV0_9PLEO|nr:hypothetical protein BDV96DRAFT_571744 [Lophiotrema nucula]
MCSQYFALAAVIATTINALPNHVKRDVWDPNGNIKLTFSSATTMLGDVKIDDIFASVGDACHTTGLCDTNDITFPGWWQADGTGGTMGPITVTVGPSGSYPTWIRNGLLDSLKAAVVAGAKCGDSTNIQPCVSGDETCTGPVKTVAYQCEVPAFWGIDYQDPNAADAAPPSIAINVNQALDDGDSVCSDMLSGIGAIAGAIDGGAGAGALFSLLSLTCN